MARIHIKIADRGWILEKCASEISRLSHDVSFDTASDPGAVLQYYVNYSAWRGRSAPIELAFFTHSERGEAARKRYFDVAGGVDGQICMSKPYAEELRGEGFEAVEVISPGVDLNLFRPKVRIGVVGRTYHTGRKGEALVAAVMDIPGIEWRFTGSGWPGSSQHVPGDEMGDFYNDLDYVLVPALYEGGPMSVLEGLACGKPIIASDVGWVSDYPHIPFENGNADSLRNVLEGLVAEREALRDSVRDRTWQAWGEQHLALFDRVLSARKDLPTRTTPASRPSALLMTHGSEGRTLGGPSVRIPRTVAELVRQGSAARTLEDFDPERPEADIGHVFNIWQPPDCFRALERVRAAGMAPVLSPIYLNLVSLPEYSRIVPGLFEGGHAARIDAGLADLAARLSDRDPSVPGEHEPGYNAKVLACLDAANAVICLSELERRQLTYLGADPERMHVVQNPVTDSRFAEADPAHFRTCYGDTPFILCVGRIEPRKNQLMLAEAARRLGRRAVFIGHEGNPGYARLVREAAGPDALFIPRIAPDDPLLASAFAAADVFCLPSWAEGAPLAAIEAAAAGCPMVLSDQSSEREYFADLAAYVNPADLPGLMRVLSDFPSHWRSNNLRLPQAKQAGARTWVRHCAETLSVYDKALKVHRSSDNGKLEEDSDAPIFFDVTSTLHHKGEPTGIARVESRMFIELREQYGPRLVPVSWCGKNDTFFRLTVSEVLSGIKAADLKQLDPYGPQALRPEELESGSKYIVCGGAWIRNHRYVASLRELRGRSQIFLALMVYDLIQVNFNFFYPPGTGDVFEKNALSLFPFVDQFFTCSATTQQDLNTFLGENGLLPAPIKFVRLGDSEKMSSQGLPEKSVTERFAGKDFVLFVSSIDIRKNHRLMVDVWRRLLERRGDQVPQIVFVGRPIWKADLILPLIEEEMPLAKYVHHLQDINDATLDWLYQNCLFTVFPSLYEGWGLPVAESLAYGKFCLTSNVSSTREIAPNVTGLLDPYDFSEWVRQIERYVDFPSLLKKREEKIAHEFKPYSWSDSAHEVVTVLHQANDLPTRRSGHLMLNTYFSFRRNEADLDPWAKLLLGKGWSTREAGGVWMVASEAVLRLPAFGVPLHVRLRMHRLLQTERQRLVISRGNDTLFDADVDPTCLVEFVLPAISGAQGETVDILLKVDALVSEPTGGSDRKLGALLQTVYLASDRLILDQLTEMEIHARRNANTRTGVSTSVETSVSAPHVPSPGHRVEYDIIERNLALPARLPDKGLLFKLLRLMQIDRAALRVYGKLFARTNDSIRQIVQLHRNGDR